ncbi:dynamin-related protein 3B-like isoform X2 [Mangifera indica]|uniref:dynamin-related protein 3B-like isoform X2 n=1 Tax=Mangifera indica TaxID=29780 RepID=UPI001CFAFD42|nr:dynamin-related protein 3B-like isoform X2 [Mangifera indica]
MFTFQAFTCHARCALNQLSLANQTEMGEETSPRANSSFFTTIGSSVIPTINKLQDILTPVSGELSKISLPQVAVVGSQSSGKSSVLEALVGRDFLPRGCDICTRRPLALMLENRPRKPDDDGREWAEFRHLPGKRFYDFTTVRREILAETDREAGRNKGVSEKQIGLKISSPNVLNMTVIDLPGITKVPVGDQPSDIETRIRRMIMAFIRQENCIILAVSPANSDLATSDALQMARDADPTGTRTIGVITKLDIMDRGTNACNFLLGKVVPLRLGYVGVVNRCQEDINKNRSIREALAYEEQFFRDNPEYSGLSDRCGIPKLAKKLNQILEQHVRMVLPSLKAELNSRLTAVAKELQKYGKVVESKAEQEAILLSILARYSEAFSAMVDGKSQEMSTKELSGGARIRYIFQSIFVKTLEMSRACEVTELQRFPVLRRRLDDVMGKFLRDGVRPAEKMIGNLIEMEMDYINSSHPSFIGGSKAIEIAMQQLKSSQDGMDAERSLTSEMAQRPRTVLHKSIMNGVLATQGTRSQSNNQKAASAVGNSSSRTWGFSSLFGSRAQSGESPASESLSETLHNGERLPSAIQLREPPAILRPLEMTEHEAVEIHVTKLLLLSYYDIVRKNIQDLVPKAIMHFLVNHSKRKLHNTCIQKLYRENHVEELLQEQDEVAAIRKHTREAFLVLQQAVQTLDKVESDVSSGTLNSNSGVEAPSGLSKISAYNTWSHPRTNGDSRSSYESSYRNAKAQRLFYSEEVSFPDNSA